MASFNVAETFVGCGGSHLGFKKAKFNTVFANDIWDDATQTLKQNNPEIEDKRIITDDIYNINRKYLDDKGINENVDVLIGGVVCKGFSLAGVRNPYDERNYLYIQQLRLAEFLKPKISIIENVPSMLNMKILKKEGVSKDVKKLCEKLTEIVTQHKSERAKSINETKNLNKADNTEEEKAEIRAKIVEQKKLLAELTKKRNDLEKKLESYKYSVVEDIEKRYEDMGYDVHKQILTCSHYGCSTNRRRLFIVAVRKDTGIKWEYPKETTKDKLPTVKDAFALLDIDNLNSTENDPDNVPMNHRPSTVEKFKKIKSKEQIIAEKAKKAEEAGEAQQAEEENTDTTESNSYFSRGTSSRLSLSLPAPTLVPGHSSFQIHPIEHRSITVREGGIITGFPKDYKFYGSHSSRCMQIGNAIPVNMAFEIAKKCKKLLAKEKRNKNKKK